MEKEIRTYFVSTKDSGAFTVKCQVVEFASGMAIFYNIDEKSMSNSLIISECDKIIVYATSIAVIVFIKLNDG